MVMQAHCFGISTWPWTITNFNFPHTSTSSNGALPPAAAVAAGVFVVAFSLLPFTGFNSLWQLPELDARLLCVSPQSCDSHSCARAAEPGLCLLQRGASVRSLGPPRVFSQANTESRALRIRCGWVRIPAFLLSIGATWDMVLDLWEPVLSLYEEAFTHLASPVG